MITQLPQDDMSKYAMAQTAREGPMPLLPDMYIRDQILGLQDAESIDDAIKSQQAERMLPEATLLTMMKASEDQGHADMAQMYMGELMFLMRQKMFDRQMQQQQQAGAMGGMGAPPPGGGFDPQVMPAAAMGAPQPLPVPPQGGMRAPGQPRPGAGDAERLANIGLFGPGG